MAEAEERKRRVGPLPGPIRYEGTAEHEAEGVVFHFTDGTALSIEIDDSNARALSASRDLTPPDVHAALLPSWSYRARPND